MPTDDLVGIAEKAARGGVFLFVGNAFSRVILALGSTIARLLAPANYRFYTLTMSIPSVLSSFRHLAESERACQKPSPSDELEPKTVSSKQAGLSLGDIIEHLVRWQFVTWSHD